MRHSEVTLDDKYLLEDGRAFITGVQALIRVLLDRKRLDTRAGLNTAGFLSGYRGSPLGGLDQQAARLSPLLTAHDVVFKEGLNEDLAATAVWGSQQANLFPGATHDGVFGMWYGKAPGVDRTGDVFKHANFAGSFPTGGVLAVAGDDHACKSSTLPSQSEFAFQDFEMPVLSPADVQEVLDYGLLGISMSRFSRPVDRHDRPGRHHGLGRDHRRLAGSPQAGDPRLRHAARRSGHPAEGPADGEGAPAPPAQDPRRPGLRPRQRHRPRGAGRLARAGWQGAPGHRLPGPGLLLGLPAQHLDRAARGLARLCRHRLPLHGAVDGPR
jgi:hypothetical protein